MGKKICRSCGIEKDISSGFYAHAQMADGHLNKCKECVKSRVKKHRKENDSVREYDRWRYYNQSGRREYSRKQSREWEKNNLDRSRELKLNWIKNNPIKRKAHIIIGNAIRDGKLKKNPCEVCGKLKVHAHHEDYNKPLEVTWLCVDHHYERHRI